MLALYLVNDVMAYLKFKINVLNKFEFIVGWMKIFSFFCILFHVSSIHIVHIFVWAEGKKLSSVKKNSILWCSQLHCGMNVVIAIRPLSQWHLFVVVLLNDAVMKMVCCFLNKFRKKCWSAGSKMYLCLKTGRKSSFFSWLTYGVGNLARMGWVGGREGPTFHKIKWKLDLGTLFNVTLCVEG